VRARLAELANGVRQTREARADLMGVSVATSERILSQAGNDRSVLIDVFNKLGLPWREDYCCPLASNQPLSETQAIPVHQSSKVAPKRLAVRLLAVLPIVLTAPLLLQYTLGSKFADDNSRVIEKRAAAVQAANAGREAYHRGDYGQAKSAARRVFQTAKAFQFADVAAEALTLEGDVLAVEGRLSEALETYREALPLWSTFGNIHGKGVLLELMAVTEARLGMLDEARTHLLQSLEILRSLGPEHIHVGSLRGLGSVAAVQGDYLAARKWYDEAAAAIHDQPDDAMQTDLRALNALLLRDEGRYEESLNELEACLGYWRDLRHPRWQATTHRQIASVLILAGEKSEALRHANRAIDLYEEVGDRLGAAESRRLLSEGRAYVQSLTAKLEDYF